MRAILMSLMVFCGGAFASDLKVSIVPNVPVVIEYDAKIYDGYAYQFVKGPWYKVKLQFENTGAKPLVVSSYKFTSQSVEKYYVIQEYIVQGCMPVAPGASVFVNALYIENLPASAAFTYSVDLNVQGWIGTCEQAEGRLAEAIQFVTK